MKVWLVRFVQVFIKFIHLLRDNFQVLLINLQLLDFLDQSSIVILTNLSTTET